MANVNAGGWDQGRKSQSTGKKGAAIGGQVQTRVKLCIDCKHRPDSYGKNPHAPPCLVRPHLGILEVRDACKGDDWAADR